MNMFKPVKAKSAKEYFAALPPQRRALMDFLHQFILKTAPSLKPNFLYNMPGYGRFPYTNSKKETLDWPVVALASQKHYVSIYVCAVAEGGYLAEKHKDALGDVDVGKSCIRLKKIEDLNLKTLGKVIKLAESSPGLVGAEERRQKNKP